MRLSVRNFFDHFSSKVMYMVAMSLTGRRYHRPPHFVRPEPVEGRKLGPVSDRPGTLRPCVLSGVEGHSGWFTRQSHCNGELVLLIGLHPDIICLSGPPQ